MNDRPLAGVNLKMYFGARQTTEWVRAAAELTRGLANIKVFVLPSFVSIGETAQLLADSEMEYGAQDVCHQQPGAYTGAVAAEILAELGCTYVLVGHAERRRVFGERTAETARKAAATARAGMTPVVCFGEPTYRPLDEAIKNCCNQIQSATAGLPPAAPVVLAYEPEWAIGAAEPAPPAHITQVCAGVRDHLQREVPILYGGSAGPGLFRSIAPAVDGLFLGRFVHDPANLRAVLAEMSALSVDLG